MALEQLAYLAQVIGTVFVVASLVYVAKQLRQNTEAIHAQSRQAILNASQWEIFEQMENPDILISITKPDSLTAEENVRLNLWLFAFFRAREFAWLQFQNNVIDASQWKTEATVIQFFFDSQKVRDWWNMLGRRAYDSEYGEFVDSVIAAQPATETIFPTVIAWTAMRPSSPN